jgi:hypothetical protein
MITATGHDTATGRKMLLLGLSRDNIGRLLAGWPIRVSAESHPGYREDAEIHIVFGETEEAILAELRGFGLIDAGTELLDQRGDPQAR